ncbi:hypothetical protein B0T24DRAFT_114834 [Lasiosphaeria ovina]|uniref:Uncharacterized protein n=1 Tax=Lasiosphaeria ovina TaxID=92902 RepID=A0AAE0JTC7_9PEZI|nr:hypothetical protein B0T24DRAFT_114834 [Lasiosphaeria ovina]
MYVSLRNCALALAALAAVVNSAPLASGAGTSANYVTPTRVFKRVHINNCGPADFINRSSGGSPKIGKDTLASPDLVILSVSWSSSTGYRWHYRGPKICCWTRIGTSHSDVDHS